MSGENHGLRPLRRLARCDGAVAAIEFAIIAPILIIAFLLMIDVGRAIGARMEMDRNVRAGAQAAMSLNNNMASIEGIIEASTEMAEDLDVTVNLECACAEATASCTTPCPDASAPSVFVEISTMRPYDGILLSERSLESRSRVQIR